MRDDSAEHAAIMARIAAEYPACVICGWACVAGQTDNEGRPAHLTCQKQGRNPYKPHKKSKRR